VSTPLAQDVQIVVIGAGVVGSAVALALARRGAPVALVEAEPEPGLGASGTNSGILHTGFDSPPGELETDLLLASAADRDGVLDALGIPVLRCGAIMWAANESQREALRVEAVIARRNGVTVVEREGGTLEIPGEAVTDPVAYVLALVAEAQRQGAVLRTGFRVAGIDPDSQGLTVRAQDGAAVRGAVAVNCAGLEADEVARLVGDESFSIYPRKGEFLVFDPPGGEPLQRILLPVPSPRTRGVLVFPTVEGHVIAGPTAVDQDDKRDWSVRGGAIAEIMPRAISIYPPLQDVEPIAAYVGLRPAGRGVNYVIGPSPACPKLVNVAAIRSTGLSASLGIGQRVAEIVGSLGVCLGPEQPLRGGQPPRSQGPWWQRTARHRAVAA
jgi:glycerol-3-phosphate dehydrogenase